MTTHGTAYCWNENVHDQLGVDYEGVGIDQIPPIRVESASNLYLESISVGGGHNCAVAFDGAAYCWGRSRRGEIGLGNVPDQTEPVALPDPGEIN